MREPPRGVTRTLVGASDTSGRASERAGDSREGERYITGFAFARRNQGFFGAKRSPPRQEVRERQRRRKPELDSSSQRRKEEEKKRERLPATRKRVRIREARMVRRFCNGAVALGIALTACAAFPRAVMAIDLSRFYGHFNTKRSGKSTTGVLGTAKLENDESSRKHCRKSRRDRVS